MFWTAHARNKPGGKDFFSEEFKHLITSMLAFDPSQRLTLAEVKAHPWYNGPTATLEDIQQEFAMRKQRIDEEAEIKRQEKEVERVMKARKAGGPGGAVQRKYAGYVKRSDGQEGEEEKKYEILPSDCKRELEEYVRIWDKKTELFSTADPDVLLEMLADYSEQQGFEYAVAPNKYKVKLPIVTEGGDKVEMKIELFRVDPEKVCVDFTKTDGDKLHFYNEFMNIKNFLGGLIDATYTE